MCSQITYVPTYSPYSPTIPSLNACDGEVVSSRGLSNCMQQHDNLDVALSKCEIFSPDMQASVTTQSPAGNVTSTILNGELSYSCAIGESLVSVSPSITCQIGIPNYQSLSCDTNLTPTQLVVTKTSVATSQGLETLPLIINPAPLTTTALGSDSVIYTFSPSAVVSLSVSNTASVVLDSFSGDCSGQSCSVSMSSNKSVLVSLRSASTRFTLLDLNTAPVYKCMKGDGTDLTPIFGESKTLCENSSKTVSWDSYTCEDKSEMECYSFPGCNVSMGGGGGPNFQCYDNFDEFSCTGMMSGCMWDGFSCSPNFSTNSCTGGTQQSCFVQGNYQSSLMENQCSQEYLTGISVPSGKTQNGLTDSPSIKEQDGKIIASIADAYETYSSQHISMRIASIDLLTSQYSLSNADSVQLNQLEPKFIQDGKTIFWGFSASPVPTQSVYTRNNSGVISKIYSTSASSNLMGISGTDKVLLFQLPDVMEINVNTGASSSIATISSYYLFKTKTATRNYFCIRSDASGFKIHAILDDENANPRLIKYNDADCGNDFSNTLQVLDYTSDKVLFTRSTDNKLYSLDSSGVSSLVSSNLYNFKKPFVNSLGDILMTLRTSTFSSSDAIYKSSSPYTSGSESILINPNPTSIDDTRFIGEINGKTVFFSRYTNSSSTPWKLYAYDNVSGVISDLITFDILGFPQTSEIIIIQENINHGVVLGGKLYYVSSSALWETDGTAIGTKIVDHPEFPFDGYFQGISKVGNKLALVYSDPQKGKEILLFDPSQP